MKEPEEKIEQKKEIQNKKQEKKKKKRKEKGRERKENKIFRRKKFENLLDLLKRGKDVQCEYKVGDTYLFQGFKKGKPSKLSRKVSFIKHTPVNRKKGE